MALKYACPMSVEDRGRVFLREGSISERVPRSLASGCRREFLDWSRVAFCHVPEGRCDYNSEKRHSFTEKWKISAYVSLTKWRLGCLARICKTKRGRRKRRHASATIRVALLLWESYNYENIATHEAASTLHLE